MLEPVNPEIPLPEDKRAVLVAGFKRRYGFTIPTNYQPSEPTLKLLMRTHQLRLAEFLSLNKITSLVEYRSSRAEPHKYTFQKRPN